MGMPRRLATATLVAVACALGPMVGAVASPEAVVEYEASSVRVEVRVWQDVTDP